MQEQAQTMPEQAAAPPELFRQEGGELKLTAEGREFSAVLLGVTDAAAKLIADRGQENTQAILQPLEDTRNMCQYLIDGGAPDAIVPELRQSLSVMAASWRKLCARSNRQSATAVLTGQFIWALTDPESFDKALNAKGKAGYLPKPEITIPSVLVYLNDTLTNGMQHGARTAEAKSVNGKTIAVPQQSPRAILNTGAHNVILSDVNKAIVTGYFDFYFAENSPYKGDRAQKYITPLQRQVYCTLCSFWQEHKYREGRREIDFPFVYVPLRKIWESMTGESERPPDKRARPSKADLKEIDEAVSFWGSVLIEADLSRDYKAKAYGAVKRLKVKDFPILSVSSAMVEFSGDIKKAGEVTESEIPLEKKAYILNSEPYLYTFARIRNQVVPIKPAMLCLDEFKGAKFSRVRMTPERRSMLYSLQVRIQRAESAWREFAAEHKTKQRKQKKKPTPPKMDDFLISRRSAVFTTWETLFQMSGLPEANRAMDKKRRDFCLQALDTYKAQGYIQNYYNETGPAPGRGGQSRSLGVTIVPNIPKD